MSLELRPALSHPELLAKPVAVALAEWAANARDAGQVEVAEIDPELADTAAFCEHYDIPLEKSANCVIIAAKRRGDTTYAACLVTAVTRADVNGVVRNRLGARKASFAPVEEALAATGMEYGGITPIGLPSSWPVLIDSAVVQQPYVIIGSGIRGSKLLVPGPLLARLPAADVIDGLAAPAGAG
jgi:prolyl-tRNA editing enzyme YbaK/EbsC (Cys-tRNA(Pro) deacylase)